MIKGFGCLAIGVNPSTLCAAERSTVAEMITFESRDPLFRLFIERSFLLEVVRIMLEIEEIIVCFLVKLPDLIALSRF